ncbi:MAG: tetratricopeptide repeat protein, partial [Acidobacteriia bacterium]|nr:tetratricopeptide repeat protein [Terriglobia bacterium]
SRSSSTTSSLPPLEVVTTTRAGGTTQTSFPFRPFTSTRLNLNDRRPTSSPQLPDIVLSREGPEAVMAVPATDVPRPARRPWAQALKQLTAENWPAAERALLDTTAAAPGFAPAWAALGTVFRNQRKPADARQALERAVALDPKRLALQMELAGVEAELKNWPAAAATADALIGADSSRTYLEAYLVSAVARYQQRDYAGALARINELIRLDTRQQLPRAGYIRGVILEARGELDPAAAEMRRYLEQHPRSADAAAVKNRLEKLGKEPAVDLAADAASADLRTLAAGEAPVPGGIRAFLAIARIPGTPGYGDFFLQYCRAIVGPVSESPCRAGRSGTCSPSTPTREASDAIRAFISTIPELERLGERTGDRVVIRLSVESPEQRQKTERALTLLGWRLRESGEGYGLEAGDQLIDGLRQRIPGAFGVDELAMREAVAAGRPFQFEIPVENARLVGGAAWGAVLKDGPAAALGAADIFVRDWRFARAYAGLGALETETAAAVVAGVGLVPLIAAYSEPLAAYGESLALSGGRATVPGGARAEAAWAKVAGVSPQSPPAFFRALFEKDGGALLAFFFDLWRRNARRRCTSGIGDLSAPLLPHQLPGAGRRVFYRSFRWTPAAPCNFPAGGRPGPPPAGRTMTFSSSSLRWRPWPRWRGWKRNGGVRSMRNPSRCWRSTMRSGATSFRISSGCRGWGRRSSRLWLASAKWRGARGRRSRPC